MRKSIGIVGSALSLGAAALGIAGLPLGSAMREEHHKGRTRFAAGHRGLRRGFGAPANINRWTGQPHEHKREIARRERQKAAKLVKQYRAKYGSLYRQAMERGPAA